MAWLGSLCGFDAQTYNPSQEKKIITKKKENYSVCITSLCHCFSLCHESLWFVVPLCICICTGTLYIDFIPRRTSALICCVKLKLACA